MGAPVEPATTQSLAQLEGLVLAWVGFMPPCGVVHLRVAALVDVQGPLRRRCVAYVKGLHKAGLTVQYREVESWQE